MMSNVHKTIHEINLTYIVTGLMFTSACSTLAENPKMQQLPLIKQLFQKRDSDQLFKTKVQVIHILTHLIKVLDAAVFNIIKIFKIKYRCNLTCCCNFTVPNPKPYRNSGRITRLMVGPPL